MEANVRRQATARNYYKAWQEPMRLWPTYADPSHLGLLHFKGAFQSLRATATNLPYRMCVAMIGSKRDPTGVQHYNFVRKVSNLRIAVVQIQTINAVRNATIAVLWNSRTTLQLSGDGFQYGDMYISIQPMRSRCDGTSSITVTRGP